AVHAAVGEGSAEGAPARVHPPRSRAHTPTATALQARLFLVAALAFIAFITGTEAAHQTHPTVSCQAESRPRASSGRRQGVTPWATRDPPPGRRTTTSSCRTPTTRRPTASPRPGSARTPRG